MSEKSIFFEVTLGVGKTVLDLHRVRGVSSAVPTGNGSTFEVEFVHYVTKSEAKKRLGDGGFGNIKLQA